MVQDSWHDDYQGAPVDGSAWEKSDGGPRVVRGGSWGSGPKWLRSAARHWTTAQLGQRPRVPSGQDLNPLTFMLFPFTGVQGRSPLVAFLAGSMDEKTDERTRARCEPVTNCWPGRSRCSIGFHVRAGSRWGNGWKLGQREIADAQPTR